MTFQTRGDGEGGSSVSGPNRVRRLVSFTLCIIVIFSCIRTEIHLFEKELRESSSGLAKSNLQDLCRED